MAHALAPQAAPRRATGMSLAAIGLAVGCFLAVMGLHVARGDMDPMQRVMSEYANGSYGLLMTVAFYAFGLASLALAVRLRSAVNGSRLLRAVPLLLGISGLALVLSGMFEVGRPLVPDTIEETIHSTASILAFVLLVTSMLLFSYAIKTDSRWTTFGRVSWPLALVAAAAAMASPWAGQTAWAGIVQRILGLAVLTWLVSTPVRIRANAFRRGV